MDGCAGSATLISRIHPQRHPWLSSVTVPYTSSLVRASFRLGTWTAEWLLGQSFDVGSPNGPMPCLAQPPGKTPGTAVGAGGSWSQTGRFTGLVRSLSLSESTVPGGIELFAMA